jgi:hypothetical protein
MVVSLSKGLSCPGKSAKRVFALDDPGIHLSKKLDCRVKPGNDEQREIRAEC